MLTVGDLHQLVLAKLGPLDAPRCLTSAAFHRTRRALMAALRVQRRDVRPDTPLAPLLPWATRRHAWQQLRAALGLHLPALEHPPAVRAALLTLGLLLTLVVWTTHGAAWRWLPLVPLAGLLAYGPLLLVTSPLARSFPDRSASVGDLARAVLERNHRRLAERKRGTSEPDVWSTLRGLVCRQLGVAPERITPQTRFVADLGLS